MGMFDIIDKSRTSYIKQKINPQQNLHSKGDYYQETKYPQKLQPNDDYQQMSNIKLDPNGRKVTFNQTLQRIEKILFDQPYHSDLLKMNNRFNQQALGSEIPKTNTNGMYRRSYTPWWAVGLTSVIIAIFVFFLFWLFKNFVTSFSNNPFEYHQKKLENCHEEDEFPSDGSLVTISNKNMFENDSYKNSIVSQPTVSNIALSNEGLDICAGGKSLFDFSNLPKSLQQSQTADQLRQENQRRRANHKKIQQKLIKQSDHEDRINDGQNKDFEYSNHSTINELHNNNRDYFLSFGDKQFESMLNYQPQNESKISDEMNQNPVKGNLIAQQQDNVTFQHYNSSKFASNQQCAQDQNNYFKSGTCGMADFNSKDQEPRHQLLLKTYECKHKQELMSSQTSSIQDYLIQEQMKNADKQQLVNLLMTQESSKLQNLKQMLEEIEQQNISSDYSLQNNEKGCFSSEEDTDVKNFILKDDSRQMRQITLDHNSNQDHQYFKNQTLSSNQPIFKTQMSVPKIQITLTLDGQQSQRRLSNQHAKENIPYESNQSTNISQTNTIYSQRARNHNAHIKPKQIQSMKKSPLQSNNTTSSRQLLTQRAMTPSMSNFQNYNQTSVRSLDKSPSFAKQSQRNSSNEGRSCSIIQTSKNQQVKQISLPYNLKSIQTSRVTNQQKPNSIIQVNSKSKTPQRKNIKTQISKYQNSNTLNVHKQATKYGSKTGQKTPKSSKKQSENKDDSLLNLNVQYVKDIDELVGTNLNNRLKDTKISNNYSLSMVGDVTNNTSLVFNNLKLEKVQGSCLPSSHAFSPFNDQNRYLSEEGIEDSFEEKNFISSCNTQVLEKNHLLPQYRNSQVIHLKQKIDQSINQLNSKIKDENNTNLPANNFNQDSILTSQIFDQNIAGTDSVRCSQLSWQQLILQPHSKSITPQRKGIKAQNFEQYLSGQDALQKFAFSLMIVKEMTKKHPYLINTVDRFLKNH
ncbi:UNKNOWN [Stylonychia lemnae]|uniref:Transmembrane protein n=1 Tax=Stylonychia lemnae TaxID=5949 RepID=A0A077ZQ25_STYLE|nr:UNKNOWN [Stylonychia lemnae]|eukprot:CDW71564.1 UNKNOWN [Stylonychia lemnae]